MGVALLIPAQADPIAAAMLLAAPVWVGLWIWTFSTRRPLRLWVRLAVLATLSAATLHFGLGAIA